MPSIRSPTAPGSLAGRSSKAKREKPLSSAPDHGQDTPQDRIPINKTSSLQWHRQMGVVMPDCTTERESARRTVTRRVLYRWHPWGGRLVRVRDVVEKAGIARARCTLDGAAPELWLLFGIVV